MSENATTIKIKDIKINSILSKEETKIKGNQIIEALESTEVSNFNLGLYYDSKDKWDIEELKDDKVPLSTIEIIETFQLVEEVDNWDGSECRANIYYFYSEKFNIFLKQDVPYDSWESCESEYTIVEPPTIDTIEVLNWGTISDNSKAIQKIKTILNK